MLRQKLLAFPDFLETAAGLFYAGSIDQREAANRQADFNHRLLDLKNSLCQMIDDLRKIVGSSQRL
jgi:hypothetical protein